MEDNTIPKIFRDLFYSNSGDHITTDAAHVGSHSKCDYIHKPSIYLQSVSFKDNIKSDIVEIVEAELDFNEKVSLIFLLFDDVEFALQTLKMSLESRNLHPSISHSFRLADWARSNESVGNVEWQERFIEALSIIQNYRILDQLGYCKQEVIERYLPHIRDTVLEVDLMRKALYWIIEHLDVDKAARLVDLAVEEATKINIKLDKYDPKYLEINFLGWNSKKYITFSCSAVRNEINVYNLVKLLKVIEEPDMSEFLDSIARRYKKAVEIESPLSSLTSEQSDYSNSFSRPSLSHSVASNYEGKSSNLDRQDYYHIDPNNVGFCVIINQKKFYNETDPKLKDQLPSRPLEDRLGTDVDRDRLVEVFQSLGFNIHFWKESLTHIEIIDAIRYSATNLFKREHSCFVLCIMSHGKKGTWFIEALHNEMLQQEPGMDIFSIFTRVNNKISSRRHKPMNEPMWKGMTPVFQVALTKKLILPLHPAARVATAKKIICRFLFFQLYDEYVRRNIMILEEQRHRDP
uniref:Caspase-8 n=1 Tax=Timema cristinae TaxID=61476 RepID=A0A7R9CET8_TIMCR|nr:unnamed protein product [Timema cristinae]